MSDAPQNTYTNGPLGSIYIKTALPIIFVMAMNGLLAVADALFLGHYVGPEALAAVTLMFPLYMMIVALATLVSGGMSSLLARHLGANNIAQARGVFVGAHGLAFLLACILIALFFSFGHQVVALAAGGSIELAEMGRIYLQITVLSSPLIFVLGVNLDALRNEGRVGFMAAMSAMVSLANIGFNYVLIVLLHMGVAGSAYGTILAQLLAITIIFTFRFRGQTQLRPSSLLHHKLSHSWLRILALGIPQSLNFMGIALGSAAIVAALQISNSPGYENSVSAYGIVTRVLTFAFLPLLGLTHAMQTITGNNYGARKFQRSNQSLSLALISSFIYCVIIELIMINFAMQIGQVFVKSGEVIAEVARILPIIVACFFLTGPMMMVSSHFQAIGDAKRAAILGMSKPYLFAIPLTFILTLNIGEIGIWIASPMSETMLFILTIVVLVITAKYQSLRWGIFHKI